LQHDFRFQELRGVCNVLQTHYQHLQTDELFGIPKCDVRSLCAGIGGGYCGKESRLML